MKVLCYRRTHFINRGKTDIYLQSTRWIKKNIEIPLLGICFGHQLIGLHYGGVVKKMREDRELQEIEIFEKCALFDRLPDVIQMQEDHCEFVSVPQGFKLIASSDACFNEAMAHHEKKIFLAYNSILKFRAYKEVY